MKVFKLTYNELVKQFKKPSIKIIVALILLSAIALPMVMKNVQPKDYEKTRVEQDQFMLDDFKATLEAKKNEVGQKAAIQKKYLEIDIECLQIEIDRKIGFQDWREKELQQLKYELYGLAAIEFVLEGYDKNIVLENMTNGDPTKVSKYYDLKLAEKKEVEAGFIAEIDELKNVISTGDYKRHTELEIKRAKAIIDSDKNAIAEFKKLDEKEWLTDEELARYKSLKNDVAHFAKRIPQREQDVALMQFRLDHDINYDKENWKHNSIMAIEDLLFNYRLELVTEKQFNANYSYDTLAKDYDEYVENYEKANTLRVEKMKELWYGLENDIPDLGAIKDARSTIDTTYEIYVILAIVIAIIIGGGIVASEYSTGSIRLLMIRPVSRWKILLAKLLAVLVVSFGIVVLGVALLVISSGFSFGFETLKTPVLQTIGGEIVKVDYIRYMLPQLALSTASVLFITSLVFMISTLARNTAIAVALGMLLYIGVAPAAQILIQMKQTWILNTIIPYINGSFFKLMPGFIQTLNDSGMAMNFKSGAIQLVILSVVMLVITFAVFMKKDIKN